MRMKNNKQWGYLAPELEVVHVEVEQGYALSNPNSESMPEIGEEKEEIGW